ncbi:hypothetical protein D6825_03985 [Candidatus Woesearchaeota archaeon]|nr:MAG: hypothetical protein D6825_03985 [Candidatus Woesearchaeota archaeon]
MRGKALILISILSLITLLFACAPVQDSTQIENKAKDIKANDGALSESEQKEEQVTEEIVAQAQAPAKEKEQESESQSAKTEEQQAQTAEPAYEPYTELGCENLLTKEQAAQACNKPPQELVITYKVGTRNCFVNIKHKENSRLTAGITLTAYEDGTTAAKEFQRRLEVLKLGADKSVGERAYEFPKKDRQEISFLRDEYIVEVGADTRLCTEEQVLELAKTADSHLLNR